MIGEFIVNESAGDSQIGIWKILLAFSVTLSFLEAASIDGSHCG